MNMMKQKRIDYKYYYDSKKIFSLIQDRDWSTLLCSNNQMFKHERYDILTSNPIEKIYAYKDKTVVENKKGIEEIKEDPIVVLHKLMDKYKSDITDLPFVGGAIGYLSYDLGNHYEKIKQNNNDIDVPLMAYGIYDWAIVIDHFEKITTLVYSLETDIIIFLKSCFEKNEINKLQNEKYQITSTCKSNITFEEYKSKFEKIRSYIKNGDCYQINFSQRFSLEYSGSCWSIFNSILPTYCSPYSAYINMPFMTIMCFSPERFLLTNNNVVETKPIKGTRPVSKDPNVNKKSILELTSSDKEKAENLMIVDLLRNDLGRNCEFGTVEVKELFKIETFANVHHLVSTVKGVIAKNSNIYKLLRGCFPGGSITGAPKIRAMQIINELESSNRSLYCGSIGYISFNNKADLNIAIRTIVAKDNNLYFWGGGGIVYDSEVESEYKETFDKIKPLLDLLKHSS